MFGFYGFASGWGTREFGSEWKSSGIVLDEAPARSSSRALLHCARCGRQFQWAAGACQRSPRSARSSRAGRLAALAAPAKGPKTIVGDRN